MAQAKSPATPIRPRRRSWQRARQTITAAARRIDQDGRDKSWGMSARAEQWQRDAWAYFDIVGEVKQSTYFLANTLSLVRLYVGYQPDPEQEPVQAPPTLAGVAEAQDALDRLAQIDGGHPGLIKESTVNLKVAGEMFLTIEPAIDSQPERVDVRSVSELRSAESSGGTAGKLEVRDSPREQWKRLPDDAYALRIWQRHPEFSALADSALRGVLSECEELMILSRGIKAAGRSRIAGAGIFLVPTEMDIASDDLDAGEESDEAQEDSFSETLMTAMVTPIAEEGDASGVVPIIVRGPADACKETRHLTFDRPMEAHWTEQRQELTQRMAHGLDLPVEQLTGIAKVNHWSAWQVDKATWTRYGQPALLTLLDAWTVGYLRPAIVEAGLSQDVADTLLVWFDPAGAITDPDRTSTGKDLYDRYEISGEALRTVDGFSDADKPTPEEIEERLVRAERMATAKRPADTGAAAPDSTEKGPPADGVPRSPSDGGGGSESGLRPQMALAVGRVAAALGTPQHITAAARRQPPIGHRLAAIDRDLRARLEEMADSAYMRALDRAGAKLRNRAKRNPALAAQLSTIAAWAVPATLGRTTVASLGLAEDDLLDAGVDELGPRFQAKVAQAQGQALDALALDLDLDESEIAELREEQGRDRAAAWAWLAAALVGYAKANLYSPQPQAPPNGEFNGSIQVPPGLIREALQRAGGADSGPQPGQPLGGVATGELVEKLWAKHGRVVGGWQWVYGDPGSRGTPFDPHLDLDGVEFSSWDDDVLTVTDEGSWLDTDHYYPGDHDWCQCDFIPLPVDGEGSQDDADALATVGAE